MIRSPAGALARWSFIPAWPALILVVVMAADARAQALAPPPGTAAPPPPGAATPAAATTPPAPAAAAAPALPAITTIPANVKSLKTSSEFTPALKASIQGMIAAAIANLESENVLQQSRARNALEMEATINGQPTASASYLDVYTQTLNQQLEPLAKHPSPRVRLNAAIVATDVARTANNIHLAPTAMAFLNDPSDGIVLWGVKAAHPIIAAQLRFPGKFDDALAKAIVETARKHQKGQVAGAIAFDAYQALTIDVWSNPPPPPEQIKPMVPLVLELLQARLKLYVKGVPPSPRAEQWGTNFLTYPRVWPVLDPKQQGDSMQAMVDLISLAGQQAQAANAGDLFELTQTIQRAASGVATVLPPQSAQALNEAAQLQPGKSTKDDVKRAVATVPQAVKAVPQYANLQPAPQIQGTEAAPPPASAPTTGNILIPGATTTPTVIAPGPGIPTPPGTTPAPPPPPPAPKAAPAPKTDGGGATGAPKPPGSNGPRPTAAGAGAGAGTGAGSGTTPKPAR